jgi:phosphatidylserine decarboxylase
MNYPHPVIAREGWFFIALTLIVALAVQAGMGIVWAWPFWLLVGFILQFFRDPRRLIPASVTPASILAAADGRIVAVQRCRDPFVDREALMISVFMNVFNAHAQRAPVEGTVQKIEYFPGAFLNASLDKASAHNERNAIVVETSTGETITVVQIAGLIARRILCYTHVGAPLARGQRIGFIRFGSRVDLYLPLTSRAKVAIGQKVLATSTIIAEL